MLPYVIPVDVFHFYFSRIYGLLAMQGHQLKGLACVSVYCVCRLLYKLLQAQRNKHKRATCKKDSWHKYESVLQAMDELQHPVDVSLTELPFDDLCMEVNKPHRSLADVLLAFQIRVKPDIPATTSQTLVAAPQARQNTSRNYMRELVTFCKSDKNGPHKPTSGHEKPETQAEDQQPLLLANMPFSLAEVIHLQSMDATAGLSSNLQFYAQQDAVVVQLLKAQGAVPVMRTNMPQTAYVTFASSNPVFGVTRNPFKPDRSPGGVCSGEAVIASARASVLGVGIDIAGGLRIPAHFCGVCGFKPTSGRVSCSGVRVAVEGQSAVATCVGPMSSEVAGLVAFMKSICVPLQHQLDPTVSLSPFLHQMYESTQPLCVGYFVDDGHTKCVPAIRRAVLEAKSSLEKLGYQVIPFEPPDLLDMLVKLYLPAALGDHFVTLIRSLSIDRLDNCVRRTYLLVQLPYAVRWLWSWWYYRKAWRQQFISLMSKHGVDVLLCPVLPSAAVKLGSEESFTGCLTYSVLFNLLDFPAGTVPVTSVSAADIVDLRNPAKYKIETVLERHIRSDEPGSSSKDLPVGVQVASLPYQDEMVLRVLKDLESKTSEHLQRAMVGKEFEMHVKI